MFRAEVLGKLPVVQHFYFGSILQLPVDFPVPPLREDEVASHRGHVHDLKSGWGDCCGIPVPSAFGAKEAEGKMLRGTGIKPIPFD